MLLLFLFQTLIYIFLIRYKNKIIFFKYNKIQKTHFEETPRLGGIIIFIIFYLYLFVFKNEFLINQFYIFLFGLIIILITTVEDLFSNVNPLIRFWLIMSCSFFIVYLYKFTPQIDISFLYYFFENPFFSIIFFTICLATVSNGMNIIDGLNGLAPLTAITGFISIIYLKYCLNDLNNLDIFFNLILFIIIFLIFNFPFGKIFLGDAGAYWLGWLLGIYVLELFYYNNQLSSWYAVIILFYPTMEVIFSFIRKILEGKSPFEPDLKHIHLKMFHNLSRYKFSNPISTIILIPLLMSPLLLLYLAVENNFNPIFLIITQICIYFFYYRVLPEKKN